MNSNQDSSSPVPSDRHVPAPDTESSEAFWEQRYAAMTKPSGGRPSAVLTRFAAELKAGRSLELGCARGDDAIWLARQGWTVTGVDVSETALRAARTAAELAGVADRTSFVRHDLSETFPGDVYDLVTAMFLQSPVEFGRVQVLRRAVASVACGGLLLIVAHGSRAPWSWAAPDTIFPTAEDELANLNLEPGGWRKVFIGPITREATGPDGQRATVVDTVVAVERR